MYDKSKHRWFQFSLRTLLVLVTLICVACGWYVHRAKEWIRQRQAVLDRNLFFNNLNEDTPVPNAPGGLWMFGEMGVSLIVLDSHTSAETQEEVRRLFPEAEVTAGIQLPGGSIF